MECIARQRAHIVCRPAGRGGRNNTSDINLQVHTLHCNTRLTKVIRWTTRATSALPQLLLTTYFFTAVCQQCKQHLISMITCSIHYPHWHRKKIDIGRLSMSCSCDTWSSWCPDAILIGKFPSAHTRKLLKTFKCAEQRRSLWFAFMYVANAVVHSNIQSTIYFALQNPAWNNSGPGYRT